MRSRLVAVVLLTICSCVGSLLAPFRSAVADPPDLSMYNREAAVQYADAWSGNGSDVYNPDYPAPNNDCTNFVSQVLWEGGMPEIPPGTLNQDWKPHPQDLPAWINVSAFEGAFELAGRISILPTTFTSPTTHAEPGDVIMYDWGEGESWSHLAFVAGSGPLPDFYDSEHAINFKDLDGGAGDFIDQHTNDRYHAPWNFGYLTQPDPLIRAQMQAVVLHFQTPNVGTVAAVDTFGQHNGTGGADFNGAMPNRQSADANPIGLSPASTVADPANHRLFVADYANSRILVFNLGSDGKPLDNIADNVIGQGDLYSSITGTTATNLESFGSQAGLAYDAANSRLFVSDTSNNRVLIYDLSGGITDGMAASFVLGQSDFVSSTAYYGAPTAGSLIYPSSLAYDPSNQRLFVVDGFSNNRLVIYDLSSGVTNGMNASWVIGQSSFTSTTGLTWFTDQGNYLYNAGVAYDSSNQRLFLSDSRRIAVFDLSSGISNGMAPIGWLGGSSYLSAYGATAVAYDSNSQSLFVSDFANSRILRFNISGGITNGQAPDHVIGQDNFSGSQPATTQAGLYYADAVSFDAAHNRLWVSDALNNRLVSYDVGTGVTNGTAADTILGQSRLSGTPNFQSNRANNNQPTPDGLASPSDVVVDPKNHRMFAVDTGNARIVVYGLDSSNNRIGVDAGYVMGQPDLTSGPGPYSRSRPLSSASNAVWDYARSRLFVADGNRVLVYDLSEGLSGVLEPAWTLGVSSLSDSEWNYGATPSASNIAYATGLAFDVVDNRLFVADGDNNRVLTYELFGGITNGMAASYVFGQQDFSSNYQNSGTTSLNYPSGMFYDSSSLSLWVADSGNNRVLQYSLSGGPVTGQSAATVLGQTDFASTDSAVSPEGLNWPSAVTYDQAHGELLVTDSGNNRVVGYDAIASVASGQAAVLSLGQPGFVSSEPGTGSEGLNWPTSSWADQTSGLLHIVDSGNNRIISYRLS
jgi:DNA-binding beta-propeller fold protein YncE